MKIFLSALLLIVSLGLFGQIAEVNKTKADWPICPLPDTSIRYIVLKEEVVLSQKRDYADTSFYLEFVKPNKQVVHHASFKNLRYTFAKNIAELGQVSKVRRRRFCEENLYGSRFIENAFHPAALTMTATPEMMVASNGTCLYINAALLGSGGSSFSLAYYDYKTQQTASIITNNTPYFNVDLAKVDTSRGIYIYADNNQLLLYKVYAGTFNISGTPLENSVCNANLEKLTCGVDIKAVVPGVEVVRSLNAGEVLHFNGFPLKVMEGYGSFYETAISLPFDNSRLYRATLESPKVDSSNNIIDGVLTLTSTSIDNFSLDTFNIGEEICQKKEVLPAAFDESGYDEEGYDIHGFDSLGIHKVTGEKYDENGFDQNGEYEGGGLYDEDGCNIDRKNKDGEACKPTQDQEKLKSFIADIKKKGWNTKLDSIYKAYRIKLHQDSTALQCVVKRTDIVTKLTAASYDRALVVGKNDEYIKSGMSEQFISKPLRFAINLPRNPLTMALEDAHISLFECDLKENKIHKSLSYLDADTYAEYLLYIDQALASLSQRQVEKFQKDKEAFNKWLLNKLKAMVSSKGYYTDGDKKSIPTHKYIFNRGSLLAGTDFIETNSAAETRFLFDQGFKTIHGLNRVHFLEQLSMQKIEKGMMEEEIATGPIEKLSDLKETKGTLFKTYFDNIVITKNSAKVDVYLIFEENRMADANGKTQKIVFSARDISFGPGGFTDTVKIGLESVVNIAISNALKLTLKRGTQVKVNCDGFQGLVLDGGLTVCPNMVRPHNKVTLKILPIDSLFTLDFKIGIKSWNDIYLGFSGNKPFSIVGYESVIWEMKDLILDLSQGISPSNIVGIPVEYASKSFGFKATLSGGAFAPEWEGLFIRDLGANLPKAFKKKDGALPRIGISNVLIDGSGFTGEIAAKNIIPFESGNLDGWQFSVSDLSILILQNEFKGGGFGGRLQVPVLDSALAYTAKIYAGDKYEFNIQPAAGKTGMPLFSGSVRLYNTSKVTLSYANEKFVARAHLDGTLDIGNAENKVSVGNLQFNNFVIANKAPYINIGNWRVVDTLGYEFAGFGFNINRMGAYNSPNPLETGLAMSIDLKLSDVGISAGGDFKFIGRLDTTSGFQKWKFKKIDISGFRINATFKGNTLAAEIQRYTADDTYGDGFMGKGVIGIPTLGKAGAFVLFGKKPTFKYFAVEAFVELKKGIQAGPITINGLGGGLSNNMDMIFNGVRNLEPASGDSIQNYVLEETTKPSTLLATSITGVQFVPDASKGFGMQLFGFISLLKSKTAFNGVVRISALFNDKDHGGGLNNMRITGIGVFMSKTSLSLNDLELNAPGISNAQNSTKPPKVDSTNVTISAYIDFQLAFRKKEEGGNFFDGTLYAFAHGGKNFLRGAGSGGKLVDGKIHITNKEWYIYLGTPSSPCGLQLNFGIAKVLATAYFDIGNKVPAMPALPADVKEIAYTIKENTAMRNLGAGFTFGAAFTIEASAKLGKIASAQGSAGAGFDIMLRKFENAVCKETNEEMGINGWYGMGQLWAFVKASLNVGGVNVLSMGVAAVLQVQAPAPSSARGTVGVKVSTFFGSIKKSVSLQIGSDCAIQQGGADQAPPAQEIGMDIIASILPGDGIEDVPLSDIPVANFNVNLHQAYMANDLGGQPILYKAMVESATMSSAVHGTLPATVVLHEDGMSAAIKPDNFLPSADSITVALKIKISRTVGGSTTHFYEERSIRFATVASAIPFIPRENIAYSYPTHDMVNFHKEEYNAREGYIQLVQGQDELFEEDGTASSFIAKIKSGNLLHTSPVAYDVYTNRLTFDLPPSWLQNGKVSSIVIVKEEKIQNGNSEAALNLTEDPDFVSDSASVERGELIALQFRVSKYNTFAQKIATISSSTRIIDEPFDNIDLRTPNALVSIEIDEQKFDPCFKYVYDQLVQISNTTPILCGYMTDTTLLRFDVAQVLQNSLTFSPFYYTAADIKINPALVNVEQILDVSLGYTIEDGISQMSNFVEQIYVNKLDVNNTQTCKIRALSSTVATNAAGCSYINEELDISPVAYKNLLLLRNLESITSDVKLKYKYTIPGGRETTPWYTSL
jgi:hypothetical protein